MLISVVITNFNGAHLLKKNLPIIISLLEQSKLEYEIIIVDDASTDDSKEVLTRFTVERGSRFTVIYKDKNEGFASTVDTGIRAAKGEYVFTLKTDTVPESSGYFQLLLDHFKNNDKLFAVSATLKSMENGGEELRGCGQIYFEKGFFLHHRSTVNCELGSTCYTSWADGSASVFKKEIYLTIGGFDPLFNPFYWEDVDLGYRAWKCGYTIEYEPKAVLIHDFEKGAINSHYSKEQQRAISLRNQFLFLWKNADFKHLLLHIIWWPYQAAISLKNGNWDFFKAHLWIKFHFVSILKWRMFLHSQVIQSDDKILQ